MKIKTIAALVAFLLFSRNISAQNIPNASFDSICVCAIDRVFQWITSDLYNVHQDTVVPLDPDSYYPPYTVMQNMAMFSVQLNYFDTNPAHNTYSLKLITNDTIFYPDGSLLRGFITNGDAFYTGPDGLIDFKKGGTPFPHRPSHILGKYKFEDTLTAVPHFGLVKVLLKKYNSSSGNIDTIGVADSGFALAYNLTWTDFRIPISYLNNDTPDSIVVLIQSSSVSPAPTTLWIDDIEFEFSTGTDEIEKHSSVQVFPNPAQTELHLIFRDFQDSEYRITDIQGRLLLQGRATSIIDISKLIPGQYQLELYNSNSQERWIRQIVKTR
ncbi:MAG: T9SS C-terminal target domain-containing protein [Bacteroidetes bacterium]|nr:MAG: T9SS C-terminal target domain-containing protein [Bacteroidota bacterium]REK04937.1 MAG: T9SS C-terminal target domain-containing protein [Bacteroidota bacterium]REK36559.1 MAG: T9SS C-terminal target domain-containing protein [Bacteroidota bacterium]REK50925.1 MAG: T9SS C-terminal target domain-containing protein [Bacteroidota bacterium]